MPTTPIAINAAALSLDPRQVARLSREMGFTGLQFDAYGSALRFPDLSASGRREFRGMLSTQNQSLVGLRVELGSKGLLPGSDVDRLLHGLDRAMESAAELGAPLLCVDLGPLPEPERLAPPKPKINPAKAGAILLPESFAVPDAPSLPTQPPPDPAFVSQVDAALAQVGEQADRYNTILAFRTDLASFAAVDAALKRVDCPWFGIDLDPTAMLEDEWPADEIFSRLGARIRHVRACDAAGGAHRRTQPTVIGRGDTDWPGLLSRLDAVGYHGWLTIDPMELPDRSAAARAALVHLRM